jgi:hypothetical protein
MNNNQEQLYIVHESDLIEYLSALHELRALHSGGVDNWEWACESCRDYLKNCIKFYNIIFEDEEDEDDFTFEDVAKLNLKHFTKYNKENEYEAH